MADFSAITGEEDNDLLVLNKTPLALQFEVFVNGLSPHKEGCLSGGFS